MKADEDLGAKIPVFNFQDITGPKFLQVEVREDGKVLWIHVNGITVLRACRIENLLIQDARKQHKTKRRRVDTKGIE